MVDLSKNEFIINRVINDNFTERVRRSCFIIDSNSLKDEEIIDIALKDIYPRIMFRIAFVKDKANNPIFKGIGENFDYNDTYLNVLKVITKEPFGSAFLSIAALLCSAHIIRNIPLNSDIKLLDLAKQIEDRAIEDLEVMIGTLAEDPQVIQQIIRPTGSIGSEGQGSVTTDPAFYFAPSINKETVPPEVFDYIKESALLEDVDIEPNIKVPSNKIAFCWFYITSVLKNGYQEGVVLIKDGQSIESLIEDLAGNINEAAISLQSPLIASPNRGELRTITAKYTEDELYPELTINKVNSKKEVSFYLTTRIHSLRITSRLLSPISNREIICINIYSLDKDLFINNSPSTEDLLSYRSIANRGIDGVIYGIKPYYKAMSSIGPHSLLVDIEKGNVNISSVIKSPNDDDDENDSNIVDKSLDEIDTETIDTFFFRLQEGVQSLSGQLKVRVSTAPISPNINEWIIPINTLNADQIAFQFLNSFYINKLHNQVLGSMSSTSSVQMVSFIQTEEEIRIIVDILEVPKGLEIAIGNPLRPITTYKNGPRSINIKARLDFVNYARNTGPDSGNSNMRVGSAVASSPSPGLSKVNRIIENLKYPCGKPIQYRDTNNRNCK